VSKSLTTVCLTSDGRCLERFDRENRPVAAEHVQFDRQEQRSREYDREFVPNATVQELNRQLLDSIGAQIAPGFSPEKLIQLLDLGEYGPNGLQLRRAALLLFGNDILKWHPRCEVRILRASGTEIGSGTDYNVTEDETVRGNVIEILESAWDRLRPYLARTKFQPNALFRESIMYPEDACREALINAVAHRDYSAEGEPIEIVVFDDRMEVRSPGDLLATVTVPELVELKRVHESRNVFIARVLRELGYMREMGKGMRRIFSSVRQFDLVDPQLRSETGNFSVTLFHQSMFSQKDIQWLEGFSEFGLTKDEQRVVLLGRDGDLISTTQIMETLGYVDTEDFRALFEGMRRKGLIYSARSVAGGGKRNIPRFQVRAPQEAMQYLDELVQSLADTGSFERLGQDVEGSIRKNLSSNSPYRQNPGWTMSELAFMDSAKRPLPKLSAVWKNAARAATVPLPNSSTTSPQLVNTPSRLVGSVTAVKDNGFGFARADAGEDFFLHVSAFEDSSEFAKLAIYRSERSADHRPTAETMILEQPIA